MSLAIQRFREVFGSTGLGDKGYRMYESIFMYLFSYAGNGLYTNAVCIP